MCLKDTPSILVKGLFEAIQGNDDDDNFSHNFQNFLQLKNQVPKSVIGVASQILKPRPDARKLLMDVITEGMPKPKKKAKLDKKKKKKKHGKHKNGEDDQDDSESSSSENEEQKSDEEEGSGDGKEDRKEIRDEKIMPVRILSC